MHLQTKFLTSQAYLFEWRTLDQEAASNPFGAQELDFIYFIQTTLNLCNADFSLKIYQKTSVLLKDIVRTR